MRHLTAYEIEAIEWERAPDRVEPGEGFDLVVRVFGSADEETTGAPITFYIDGDELETTTGADIEPGGFAFDGLVDVRIDEEGTYELVAEVEDFQTEPHYIGVGEDPDPRAAGGGGVSPVLIGAGLVGAEVLRRILT